MRAYSKSLNEKKKDLEPLRVYLEKAAYPKQTIQDMHKLYGELEVHVKPMQGLNEERERVIQAVDSLKEKVYESEDILKERLDKEAKERLTKTGTTLKKIDGISAEQKKRLDKLKREVEHAKARDIKREVEKWSIKWHELEQRRYHLNSS